jgi:hypothetical protein
MRFRLLKAIPELAPQARPPRRVGRAGRDPGPVDRANIQPSLSVPLVYATFMPPLLRRRMELGLQMRSSVIISVRHLLPSALGIVAPLTGVVWLLFR